MFEPSVTPGISYKRYVFYSLLLSEGGMRFKKKVGWVGRLFEKSVGE